MLLMLLLLLQRLVVHLMGSWAPHPVRAAAAVDAGCSNKSCSCFIYYLNNTSASSTIEFKLVLAWPQEASHGHLNSMSLLFLCSTSSYCVSSSSSFYYSSLSLSLSFFFHFLTLSTCPFSFSSSIYTSTFFFLPVNLCSLPPLLVLSFFLIVLFLPLLLHV